MNLQARPHLASLAEGHLRTWNATAMLWDVHNPGECTHYCSPSAYHVWLFLLNQELANSGLGNPVPTPSLVGPASNAAVAAEESVSAHLESKAPIVVASSAEGWGEGAAFRAPQSRCVVQPNGERALRRGADAAWLHYPGVRPSSRLAASGPSITGRNLC